jgi:glycosyltransferase involved in cell wall biosynthesis
VKLLFLTQVLDRDDAVLGFVPRWVEGLARAAERVRVVALEVGDASGLPPNVDVRSIGRRGSLGRYLRFRAALREAFRAGFDAVLAHMVPRYALMARGPARRARARLYLWYTHGTVDQRLRRAERVVEQIFTASPESLRLETPKRVVTGHGIDLAHFDGLDVAPDEPPRILSVGRLTPKKDPLTVVAAVSQLVGHGHDARLDLVGGGLVEGDVPYVEQLRTSIAQAGLAARVTLHGPVPYRTVNELYARATVCVNASLTGSLDKVVLEAMAAGRPVLSCNDAFPALVRELGDEGAALVFQRQDPLGLAQRLAAVLERTPAQRRELGRRLRAIVARDHEVDALMRRLVALMQAELAP